MSKEEKTIYLEWFQAIDEFIKDGKFAKFAHASNEVLGRLGQPDNALIVGLDVARGVLRAAVCAGIPISRPVDFVDSTLLCGHGLASYSIALTVRAERMLEVALGKGFFTEQDIVHYYVEIGKAVKNRRDQLGLYLAPGD